MKLADGITNATNFAIAAFGAVALGTAAGAGVGLLALGFSGGTLIRSVRHGYKGKFNNHIKAACKHAKADAALCAFVAGQDDAFISVTLDALGAGFQDIQPTIQNLSDWNLDPILVADGLVKRLKDKHSTFKTDANARTLARHILRAAFSAVSEQEAFWQQSELYVAKTLLARTDDLVAGQTEIKDGQGKTHGKLDELLALMRPQAQQSGVTEAALRTFIKRLGEERELAVDEMVPWLEDFIKTAQHKRNEKVNEDAPFQAALDEAQNRFDHGQGDTASDALMAELAREKQDENRRQKERTRRRIHLLREAIDYDELALKPDAAVQKWRLVAAEQGIKAEQEIVRFLFAQTDHYEQESERRGSNSAALVAIALWLEILTILTREKTPMDWAVTQNNLGNVYQVLGERGDDAYLHKAVTAYENALKEYTREKAPMDWAMTKNNLGAVYRVLGERGDDAYLHKAVTAYENALKEYTREKAPMQWAMTQNNLGNVYSVLGERGDDAYLHKAVTAYENALKEYTRENAPMQWAMTTENLGYVLWDIGEHTQAEKCMRAALAYYRSVNAPFMWKHWKTPCTVVGWSLKGSRAGQARDDNTGIMIVGSRSMDVRECRPQIYSGD